jgi:hypothetical protein
MADKMITTRNYAVVFREARQFRNSTVSVFRLVGNRPKPLGTQELDFRDIDQAACDIIAQKELTMRRFPKGFQRTWGTLSKDRTHLRLVSGLNWNYPAYLLSERIVRLHRL